MSKTDLLRDFYRGKIIPFEMNFAHSAKAMKAYKRLRDNEELFSGGLNDEDKIKFNKLIDNYADYISIVEENTYIAAFRFGAKFAVDMLYGPYGTGNE